MEREELVVARLKEWMGDEFTITSYREFVEQLTWVMCVDKTFEEMLVDLATIKRCMMDEVSKRRCGG